jgi:arginine exporter protein ArgO
VRGALVAGLLAGFGIAIPVGAVATYLVALTARTSLRIGVGAALGVATADGLYALIAMLGGAALTSVIEPVMLALRWASASVLIGLACRTGTTAISQYRKRQTTSRADQASLGLAGAYFGLLGMTMMNPITLIYFAALVLAGQPTTAPDRLDKAAFVCAALAASASWQLLLAGGGAMLGRVLTGRRGRLFTSLVSSVVITGLAAHLLISRL